MNKSKTCTDTFGFDGQPLFERLRKTLPNDTTHTKNLIECKDDMLFAWDHVDCCVLVFNWRAVQSKANSSLKFQTLVPSSPIDFSVEKITASHEGSFLALSGMRGVAIMELPCRWGPNGHYKEGKEKILCSSHNLDERFFCSNLFVNIQQVRWHPASPKDCNLIVLLSNNSIHVYDEVKLRHVWRIGAMPCAIPPTSTTVPYLNSLGDTAIDFDIAAPRIRTTAGNNATSIVDTSNTSVNASTASNTSMPKNIEWPLIILWGNGNLYVALIGLDTDKPRLQGPLSMYPPTKDNFGLDSCAILTLPSNPPTVIIAELSGKLFHAILVEINPEEKEQEQNISDDVGIKIDSPEWIVNVVEVVELELGLTEPKQSKDANHCPIFLKADINNDCRYFAYHNTGLHAISIEFMPELYQYFNTEQNFQLETLLNKPSHAEYVVCTKALNSAKPNPVLGFTLLQSPSGLVLFLSSGQIVSLNVITNPSHLHHFGKAAISTTDTYSSNAESAMSSKIFSGSFEDSIRQILASGISQPILKLNNTKNVTPKESFELLIDAIQLLRDQYIIKHDKVKQKIEKRVKILQVVEEQQRQEVAQLLIEKNQIRNNAEYLAEMYEEINDRQQDLIKRMHDILRLVNLKVPRASLAEQNFGAHIEKFNAVTKELAHNISMAKKKTENQELQITNDSDPNKKKVTLQPKQETAIKEILADANTQIDSQIKEIKRIKEVLNIT